VARIDDGFPTIISIPSHPSIKFYEKSVTPPGFDGGGENDTTTMRNTAWRTRAPKKLKTLTEMSLTVSYDAAVLDDVDAAINDNQLIEVTFPDGSTWEFWGWLNAFTPGAAEEGSQPTADVTIIPSNQNDSGVETAPSYTAPPPPPP
jgi:hypothetical protein